MTGLVRYEPPAPRNSAGGSDQIFRIFIDAAREGRASRSVLGRRIAFSIWPEVFDHIDFENDEPFLEPLLFLAGAVPELRIDLPGILSPHPLPVAEQKSPDTPAGRSNILSFENSPQASISRRGVSIFCCALKGLATLCGEYQLPNRSDIEFVSTATLALEETSPAIFEMLMVSCKRVVPIRSNGSNSFATDQMPSTAVINLCLGNSLPALVEDISHQATHCAFSDVEQGANLYRVAAHSRIGDHIQATSPDRTISVLHHSCLTLLVSCKALENLLSHRMLTKSDAMEAEARIGFLVRKMALDLDAAERVDALSAEWKGMFWRLLRTIRPKVLNRDWKYRSQGYNFNFGAFREENQIA